MTTPTHSHDEGVHEHDLGLSHDLPTLLSRRRALSLLGGAGLAAALAACGSGDSATATGTTATTSASATTGTAAAATTSIPEETAGPYPADGSNGANVLTESGIVRSDLTSSFGSSTTTAEGVPLTVRLTVLDTRTAAPLAGAAVYLWHCDAQGRYSMYDREIADENYLRGVQATAADGTLTFTTIYPAAYSGRWPHIHFEVYASLAEATAAGSKLRTSQIALPEDTSSAVYATDGYDGSAANLARTSLSSDMVFRDGYSLQMATVTGDVTSGYTASLVVPV